MFLHDGKFFVAEFAGFVQHFCRDRRFAQVVEQAGKSGNPGLGRGKLQGSGKGNHEHADSHRMHVGEITGILEANETRHGARIPCHVFDDLIDQRFGTGSVDGFAEAGFVKNDVDDALCFRAQAGRAVEVATARVAVFGVIRASKRRSGRHRPMPVLRGAIPRAWTGRCRRPCGGRSRPSCRVLAPSRRMSSASVRTKPLRRRGGPSRSSRIPRDTCRPGVG